MRTLCFALALMLSSSLLFSQEKTRRFNFNAVYGVGWSKTLKQHNAAISGQYLLKDDHFFKLAFSINDSYENTYNDFLLLKSTSLSFGKRLFLKKSSFDFSSGFGITDFTYKYAGVFTHIQTGEQEHRTGNIYLKSWCIPIDIKWNYGFQKARASVSFYAEISNYNPIIGFRSGFQLGKH